MIHHAVFSHSTYWCLYDELLKSVILTLKLNIESLKNASVSADEEKKNVLLETIEDLEYQNETNEEIMKLLNSNAIEEFRNGK